MVVLGALILNLFRDDPTTTTTTLAGSESTVTTTETTAAIQDPGPIRILVANCTPEGLGGTFGCSNLINGNEGEFQINWNELPETEKIVVIQLTFAQPMVVERIDWNNIEDEPRFRLELPGSRNHDRCRRQPDPGRSRASE